MFLRLTCRGRTIEHNVNGWRQEVDSVNVASGNSGWTISEASGRWSGARTLEYTLVCERSTRAALMDQLALAQQLVNAIIASANASLDRDPAELRADRAGTTLYVMPTGANLKILSIAQTATGWLGRVRLTIETPDPWLLVEPPTSGGTTNNSNRIVRNSITEWTPMTINFAPTDYAMSPVSWVAQTSTNLRRPALMAIGRYDEAAQKTALSMWRCTSASPGTITTGAQMNLVTYTSAATTFSLTYTISPFFYWLTHYSTVYDVWLCAWFYLSRADVFVNLPNSAEARVLSSIIVDHPSFPYPVHYLGRFSWQHPISYIKIMIHSKFPTAVARATALILSNPVDSSVIGFRWIRSLDSGAYTFGWVHRATRLWREHFAGSVEGFASDAALAQNGLMAQYIGTPDPLAWHSSVAVCGSNATISAVDNHIICRRAIGHVSE